MLKVTEIFPSIQGEGAWTGLPATFLRLSGCNLHCEWCDTKSSWNEAAARTMEVAEVATTVRRLNQSTIVVTGGEPALQMPRLCELIRVHGGGRFWHLETNGTLHVVPGMFDWVTVSPKPPEYKIHESLRGNIDELKFVITEFEDLGLVLRFTNRYRYSNLQYVCLRPLDNNIVMAKYIVDWLLMAELKGRKWRLSTQVHKTLGVK
jgi:7-carboxy-7-deazaguanine synthase